MSITTTNYISNINTTFPTPGKDNPTQVFRNNWSNIVSALSTINLDTDHLKLYAVDVTNTATSFFNNTIQNVNLKNSSVSVIDNGTMASDVTIDYSLGSYQKIVLTAGVHNISVINWPARGKSGSLTLSITATSPNQTSVNFVGTTALGPSFNPYSLYTTNNVFKLESEFSSLANNMTVFVRSLNELIFNSASADTQIATNYVVQYPNDSNSNHAYHISTSSGSRHALFVTSQISGNIVAGNTALLPSVITTTIVAGYWSSPTDTTADTFQVASVRDIIPGATFYLSTTATQLTVTVVGDNTITCSPPFPTGIGTGSVIFKNPTFGKYGEATAFPTIATMVSAAANTTTGAANVFSGSIYASANHLEITYAERSGSPNTFVVDKITPTTTSADNSYALANTNFVHQVLPYGSIIMWHGSIASIPSGWALCNGSNSTPNLTDRFLLGAGGGSAVAATGGRPDTVLPAHTHGVTEPDNGPAGTGHQHNVYYYSGTGGSSPTATANAGNTPTSTAQTEYAQTGITINSTGVSDTSLTNLPPYYAICFIMKTTGA